MLIHVHPDARVCTKLIWVMFVFFVVVFFSGGEAGGENYSGRSSQMHFVLFSFIY